jgi:hypothetical protein
MLLCARADMAKLAAASRAPTKINIHDFFIILFCLASKFFHQVTDQLILQRMQDI